MVKIKQFLVAVRLLGLAKYIYIYIVLAILSEECRTCCAVRN